jgi:hypothetical protein
MKIYNGKHGNAKVLDQKSIFNCMKQKEITLFTVFFILISILGSYLTFQTFSNQSLQSIIETNLSTNIRKNIVKTQEETNPLTNSDVCYEKNDKPRIDFQGTFDVNLVKLQEYQNLCNSFAVNTMMIFSDMPIDTSSAQKKARLMADKLKEFARFSIIPLVIIEPVSGTNKLSFREFSKGMYTTAIDSYFAELKNLGITDTQMGTWVAFPEANVPYWNFDGAVPGDFATNINLFVTIQKQYFKDSKASILLNSQTYDQDDTNWEVGTYENFAPYIKGIKKGLLDSFGVQGLPWVSPADAAKRVEQFNAKEFLQSELTLDAAKLLKVKSIWINTGTFSEKYTSEAAKRTKVSINSRKTMLNEILQEAEALQNEKFEVSINLFAEDKSYLAESTNWSYFENDESQTILKDFFQKAYTQELGLSIFDKVVQK